MEIPGYYYDEENRKYFKITQSVGAPSKYSLSAIRQEKKEVERTRKRARIESSRQSRTPFIHLEGSKISAKITQCDSETVRQSIREYKISRLRLEGSMKIEGRSDSGAIKKVSCGDEKLMLSSLNNIYQIPLNELELKPSGELFQQLKGYRVDKVHSVLRNLILTKEEKMPVIRTWFGGVNEPSEVEISTEVSDSDMLSKSKILSSKNESFNNSTYNAEGKSIVICSNKGVLKSDIKFLSGRREKIFEGGDVLSIDLRDKNTYLLGLRNGRSGTVDERVPSKSSHNTQKCMETPVINIKSLEGNRALCSSLGSKIKLFDTRMGFNKCLIDYRTTKTVEDIFGERLEVIEGSTLMIQNQSLCEFFNYNIPTPLKTMRFEINDRLTDICYNPNQRDNQFFTTNGSEIGFIS